MNSEGQRRIRETVRPHKFGATECATRFASSRGRDEFGGRATDPRHCSPSHRGRREKEGQFRGQADDAFSSSPPVFAYGYAVAWSGQRNAACGSPRREDATKQRG